MHRALRAAAIVACCAVVAIQCFFVARQRALMGDFQAFYCAGKVLLARQNPYAAGPIRACESPAEPYGLHHTDPGVSEPAPYPGYAIAAFVPFAMLPFVAACLLWFALLCAALLAAAVELSAISARPIEGTLALLACGFGIAVLPYGELPPIVLAAMLLAMRFLRTSRFWHAALALSVAALLPHIALAMWVAAFAWERRMRIPLLACGSCIVAVDVAAGGFPIASSYIFTVLPQHAQSEVGYIMQYGLTWIAFALGAPVSGAVLAGKVSYAVMLVAGVVLGGRLSRRFNDRSWIVAIPVCFIVIGGPFVHYTDVLLAIPAGVLLWSRSGGRIRAVAAAGLLAIVFPWLWAPQPWIVFPTTAFGLLIALLFFGWTPRTALRTACVPMLVCACILVVAAREGPQIARHVAAAPLDLSLAQASWAAKIRSGLVSTGIVWWIAKLPTWLGLLALAASGALLLPEKHRVTPIVIDGAPAGP